MKKEIINGTENRSMGKDFSKLPIKRLTKEEQEQFERRARALDDNDEPPVCVDDNGNYIY